MTCSKRFPFFSRSIFILWKDFLLTLGKARCVVSKIGSRSSVKANTFLPALFSFFFLSSLSLFLLDPRRISVLTFVRLSYTSVWLAKRKPCGYDFFKCKLILQTALVSQTLRGHSNYTRYVTFCLVFIIYITGY